MAATLPPNTCLPDPILFWPLIMTQCEDDGNSGARPSAGNNFFRPGSVDPHMDGSPLPKSYYVNDVGYLPDGTSLATAGNNFFRPGSVDPHMPGSPLPPPLKGYMNDAGYLPDGTPIDRAGNMMFRSALSSTS